jgi:hypothetical protein
MLCSNCVKLAILSTNKKCVRCQGIVYTNLNVLCEQCSTNEKTCSICLKKIVSQAERMKGRGCGCGSKK